eukprot:INCI3240.4.p1 GENE.INCI3240.4~~INCI3240.4.p1  ORF type:complete len:977 (+),score=119.90 INCI3240.4:1013-3943(+)
MAAKLLQMDQILRDIVLQIDDSTLLVVFGDHGMTPDGNHGGASEFETGAALFCYSKNRTLRPSREEHSVVNERNQTAVLGTVHQVDLVPTLSLLLGLPIPFGNLGQLISEFFSHDGTPASNAGVGSAHHGGVDPKTQASGDDLRWAHNLNEALAVNAAQVLRYLRAYHSGDEPLAGPSTHYGGKDGPGQTRGEVGDGRFSSAAMQDLVYKHLLLTKQHAAHRDRVVNLPHVAGNDSAARKDISGGSGGVQDATIRHKDHHAHGLGRQHSNAESSAALPTDGERSGMEKLNEVTEGFQRLMASALGMCQQQWTQFDIPAMARGIFISLTASVAISWRECGKTTSSLQSLQTRAAVVCDNKSPAASYCFITGVTVGLGLVGCVLGWKVLDSTSIAVEIVAVAVTVTASFVARQIERDQASGRVFEPNLGSEVRPSQLRATSEVPASGVGGSGFATLLACAGLVVCHAASLFSNSYLDAALGCHWFISLAALGLLAREHVLHYFGERVRGERCGTNVATRKTSLQQVVHGWLHRHWSAVGVVALLVCAAVPLWLQWMLSVRRAPGTPLGCEREPVTLVLCVLPLAFLACLAAMSFHSGQRYVDAASAASPLHGHGGAYSQIDGHPVSRALAQACAFVARCSDLLLPPAFGIAALTWAPASVLASTTRVLTARVSLGIAFVCVGAGAAGFVRSWVLLRHKLLHANDGGGISSELLLRMMRRSYVRIFFAALVPLALSQGPSGPGQVLVIVVQVLALSASSAFRRCTGAERGGTAHWRSLLPAALFFAANTGLHFYASGHDHKFSTIEFSCAYVGLYKFHPVFSALWSLLNVGAFHVLHVLSLPFLAFGCADVLFFRANIPLNSDRSTKAPDTGEGSAALSGTPCLVDQCALVSFAEGLETHERAVSYYGLWLAVEAVAAACCAAVHRRHLFVWAIFAPKFVFAAGFLVLVSCMRMFAFAAAQCVIQLYVVWTSNIFPTKK